MAAVEGTDVNEPFYIQSYTTRFEKNTRHVSGWIRKSTAAGWALRLHFLHAKTFRVDLLSMYQFWLSISQVLNES